MRAVLQRVKRAACRVDGEICGQCGLGLLILLGVHKDDTEKDAELLAEKISKLRIFKDENDKMNLSLIDVGGQALVISNFTLYASYGHGNRPAYFDSMEPEGANRLYTCFSELLSQKISNVETGEFGAEMFIESELYGPVTIVMDSDVLKKSKK
ncbi:MAG: D-tyrosyl-tRNA(Tyr) deacylase [Clostridia bacterium]|nr:D-tyrosyl-tRNA(Tyr) deacylase [Clostridia bacterium]